MLLQFIRVNPDKLQARSGDYSAVTVEAIVAEGIDLARFDPIPIIHANGQNWTVAGDGHSRFEAVQRLAKLGRLPAEWKTSDGWDIPARKVRAADAQRLKWTANFSRDGFTFAEQAGVFSEMIDAGHTAEEIGKLTQQGTIYVSRVLSLNKLCDDIAQAVGKSPAAGGIDILTGQALAIGFDRYGIDKAQQQQLWHCVLKVQQLNFQSAKRFVDRIGARLGQRSSGDGDQPFMFTMPANAIAIVAEAKREGEAARGAKTGLGLLMAAMDRGALDEDDPELSELAALLRGAGKSMIEKLAAKVANDGAILADLVTAPKLWEARPASPADAKIARQYDPEATPLLTA